MRRAGWTAGLGVLALVIIAVAGAPTAGAASGSSAREWSARGSLVAHQKLDLRAKARRAAVRRKLRRALRRDPRGTLARRDFLRLAAINDFKLPVTLRLRPGTQLGVSWVPTRFPLDGGAFPAPAGEQLLDLAGRIPMEIDFGAGAGYGGPGNLQARTLLGGGISSPGPLRVADVGGCAGTPPAFVEAATTTGGAPISAAPANQTWLDMNPFTGHSEGYLDLKFSVRSRVLESTTTCAGGTTGDYELPASTSADDPWVAPVRIRWEGAFRVAPSITSDGAVRFGKIVVDAATQPQSPTTGNLWGCAAQPAITGAGLPLPSTLCQVSGTPALGENVAPAPFPAQLTVKGLSADVLLGSVP